ncbi:hypothetical protein [Euryhalocaulis caribicus]|uniref:hypothetical protein n=1 Tax=Euryhalocaulis caribicus TaxID=1161401 RepID=UPI0003B4FA70|nr:hypothetical protein [Euryhalocaulis caribicus]
MRILLLVLGLGLAACGAPRDPHSTLKAVEGGQLRAGLVAGVAGLADDRAKLQALASEMDAELVTQTGDAHALMRKLERGELDIVASLPKNTPFMKAGFSHPAGPRAAPDAKPPVWAVRAGENAWLLRVNIFLMQTEADAS